jgi:hypothetical protein
MNSVIQISIMVELNSTNFPNKDMRDYLSSHFGNDARIPVSFIGYGRRVCEKVADFEEKTHEWASDEPSQGMRNLRKFAVECLFDTHSSRSKANVLEQSSIVNEENLNIATKGYAAAQDHLYELIRNDQKKYECYVISQLQKKALEQYWDIRDSMINMVVENGHIEFLNEHEVDDYHRMTRYRDEYACPKPKQWTENEIRNYCTFDLTESDNWPLECLRIFGPIDVLHSAGKVGLSTWIHKMNEQITRPRESGWAPSRAHFTNWFLHLKKQKIDSTIFDPNLTYQGPYLALNAGWDKTVSH